MRYKPERALTHLVAVLCNASAIFQVEMRYKPERALTLYKLIFIYDHPLPK